MNTANNTLRIGLLGGTFDPIHFGHIRPAQQAFSHYNLDKLLVIPAHKPPHKDTTHTSTIHRVNMAKLVCEQEPNFTLDTRETKRSTLSYTIDTLKEITVEYPNSEFFFIMGMDSLLEFTTWTQWEEIIQLTHLIVNTRPNYDLSTVNKETENLLALYADGVSNSVKGFGTIYFNSSNDINISSTEIRQRLSKKMCCKQWLPKAVSEYIIQQNLYT